MQPERLLIVIGGYPEYFSVEWDAQTQRLIYAHDPLGLRDEVPRRVELAPTPADWAAFWKMLKSLTAWTWAERYDPDFTLVDGTVWSVELAVQGRQVASSGHEAYPPGFKRFCGAVSRLCGGRDFR